jgi:hypothetical protein
MKMVRYFNNKQLEDSLVYFQGGFELILAKYKKIHVNRKGILRDVITYEKTRKNMFCSHGYMLIIIFILYSAKKYRSYVNSLIAVRKQKGCKSENNIPEVHASRFP